jgi:hypothetical protein
MDMVDQLPAVENIAPLVGPVQSAELPAGISELSTGQVAASLPDMLE